MTFLFFLALAIAQPGDRVILTANVNAREQPSESAKVACRHPIGTELQVLARKDGWLQVDDCGPWISAAFAREITDATRAAVREDVLRERLARQQDFATADRLIFLAEASARDTRQDREAQARHALYQLKALAMAAGAPDLPGAFRSAFARSLGEESALFFYNEIGGSWMLRNPYIWTVHQRFHDTRAADDIAWFAAENGVGGECEGDLACMLSRADILIGAYLRAHPSGRHVDEALQRLGEAVEGGTPDRATCRDAVKPLKTLRAAIASTKSARAATANAALDRIAAACR